MPMAHAVALLRAHRVNLVIGLRVVDDLKMEGRVKTGRYLMERAV